MRAPGGTRFRAVINAVLATAIAGAFACRRTPEPGPAFATVLLAETPAAPGGHARYQVTIEVRGAVWGSASDADGSCPGAAPGSDTLTGTIEGTEPPLLNGAPCRGSGCPSRDDDEVGVVYSGTLERTTFVDLCEVKDTPDGNKWCLGHL